jgi:hypothetical protein
MTVDVVIAVRSPRQNTDDSLSSGMAFAAPAALADLGAFVLGHHALDLKQQIVFRRGADRAVEEDHLDPGPPELVDQQHLVGIVAGQAVGAMDIKTVERSRRDRASRRRSSAGRTRVAPVYPSSTKRRSGSRRTPSWARRASRAATWLAIVPSGALGSETRA